MEKRKSRWVHVRLSETDHALVKEKAKKEGKSISDYARCVLLRREQGDVKKGLRRLADGNSGAKRSTKISVRLTAEERTWIEERAAWMGCTPTALTRMLIFSNDDIAPVVIDTRVLDDAYLELHRQGVNLNQLMTYLNTYKSNADTSGVSATLEKVYASLDKIENVLGDIENQWREAEPQQGEE